MKHDVLLLGASGYPNYGDDRIAIAWTQFYRRQRAKRVFLETISPSFCAAALTFAGADAIPVNFIWSRAFSEGFTSIRRAVEAGTELFESSGPLASWASELFASVGTVHLHGGGYINNQWPHSAYLVGAAIAMKRRFGTRVIATGLGLQPISVDDALALRSAFSEFDLAEFRDRPSFDAINADEPSPHLRLGLDDVFLDRADNQAKPLSSARLHLCIQQNFPDNEWAELARAVTEHINDGSYSEVRYLEFCPQDGGDGAFFTKLADALGQGAGLKRISYRSLLQNGIEASEGDCSIVTRFHAHLLLARMGVRGCFIEPTGLRDYYEFKHQSLVDVGSGWRRLTPSGPINFGEPGSWSRAAVSEKKGAALFGLPGRSTRPNNADHLPLRLISTMAWRYRRLFGGR